MPDNDKPVLIYATFPDEASATAIAEVLVTGRLIACANILPGMTAIYRWDGQLNRDREVAAVLKTTASRADAVVAAIRTRHPYDNPAIVVLAIEGGSQIFLDWVAASTVPGGSG